MNYNKVVLSNQNKFFMTIVIHSVSKENLARSTLVGLKKMILTFNVVVFLNHSVINLKISFTSDYKT